MEINFNFQLKTCLTVITAPQTKFGTRQYFHKHLSICTRGAGGWLPTCITGHMTRGSASRGSASRGTGGGLSPWGSASRAEGSASRGSACSGVCIQGVCLQWVLRPGGLHPGVLGKPPLLRYMGYYGVRSTSRRYASYWNASLSFGRIS